MYVGVYIRVCTVYVPECIMFHGECYNKIETKRNNNNIIGFHLIFLPTKFGDFHESEKRPPMYYIIVKRLYYIIYFDLCVYVIRTMGSKWFSVYLVYITIYKYIMLKWPHKPEITHKIFLKNTMQQVNDPTDLIIMLFKFVHIFYFLFYLNFTFSHVCISIIFHYPAVWLDAF